MTGKSSLPRTTSCIVTGVARCVPNDGVRNAVLGIRGVSCGSSLEMHVTVKQLEVLHRGCLLETFCNTKKGWKS